MAAGLGTNKLTLMIDGVERACEVSVAEIVNEESDSDFTAFCDAAGGGARTWGLHLIAVQDPGNDTSLWEIMWEQAGQEVDVVVKPWGNDVPSASQPHFTGTVVVSYPDGVALGGEADASTSNRFTIDVTWDFLEKPEKIIAGP